MPEDHAIEGGTGQPTSGIGGLSVPLGLHVEKLAEERDKRYSERNRRQDDALRYEQSLRETQRAADQLAIGKAQDAAAEVTEMHNGLLRRMEKLIETFPTKEAMNERFSRIEQRLDRVDSAQEVKVQRQRYLQPFQVTVVSAVLGGVITIVVAVVLANVLTG